MKSNRFFSSTLVLALGVCLSVSSLACGTPKTEGNQNIDNTVQTEVIVPEGYTLVWNDEFDGNALDETKWSYQIGDGGNYGLNNWGNGESQYYTSREENIRVEDGLLTISAIKEKNLYEGYSYTSARIRTVTDDSQVLFSTTFGRVEARVKIEGGAGIWPAFWMLPVDDSTYNGWASSGELDIMEIRGRLPKQVTGSLHYGKKWPDNVYSNQDYTFKGDDSINNFHTYAVEWDPNEIRWYVDDDCYFTMKSWYAIEGGCETNYTYPAPYDVPFYILLNLAVGGNFDPDAILKDSSFPAQMQVDYVRVFHRTNGYEDLLEKANASVEEVDYDLPKEKHANGNLIYNYSFDQGKNRTAYWTITGMDARVNSDDLQHRLYISNSESGACLKQTGFGVEAKGAYGVRFNAGVEKGNETSVVVRITDSQGKVIYKQSMKLQAAEDYVYAFKFESDTTDSLCTISFEFEKDTNISIDKVIMLQLD